jgi:hypothetical protein
LITHTPFRLPRRISVTSHGLRPLAEFSDAVADYCVHVHTATIANIFRHISTPSRYRLSSAQPNKLDTNNTGIDAAILPLAKHSYARHYATCELNITMLPDGITFYEAKREKPCLAPQKKTRAACMATLHAACPCPNRESAGLLKRYTLMNAHRYYAILLRHDRSRC